MWTLLLNLFIFDNLAEFSKSKLKMLLSLLVIWSSVLLLYYYIKKRRTFILGSKLPGPKSYPIVGNALMFLGKPESKSFI